MSIYSLFTLGIATLVNAVGEADDLCLTQTFPVAFGEDGSIDTVIYSIAKDTFSGGYWMGGRTSVSALINGGSKAWFLKVDDNNQYVEGYAIKDNAGFGYVRLGAMAVDDSSTNIVASMLYRYAIMFYTPGGSSDMYKVKYYSTTYSYYEAGWGGYSDPIVYKSGYAYIFA